MSNNNNTVNPIDDTAAHIEKHIPSDPAEVKLLLSCLTNELMEERQKVRMLEKDLKNAVKRKKAKHDPLLGHVSLVMFSRPRAENPKVRMHVCDNVKTNQALKTVKDMINDKENDFIGAHFMLPVAGKKDAYSRLTMNTESVWHLFQQLDRDLKIHDPENPKKDDPLPDNTPSSSRSDP